MQIILNISEMEIEKIRKVMSRLTDGESEYYFDYSDPTDVAQAVGDVINEAL